MFSSYLGVQSRQIPDDAMTASSAFGKYVASQARLDNTEYGACSWTAETADEDQWLQVDLGQDMLIIGVVTQSHCGIRDNNKSPIGCVTQFHIQYSSDGNEFVYMMDGDHRDVSKCATLRPIANTSYAMALLPLVCQLAA